MAMSPYSDNLTNIKCFVKKNIYNSTLNIVETHSNIIYKAVKNTKTEKSFENTQKVIFESMMLVTIEIILLRLNTFFRVYE